MKAGERTETVNGIVVTARYWSKNGLQRLYFSTEGNRGQACWDLVNRQWVAVHCEVGSKFKVAIKKAFRL